MPTFEDEYERWIHDNISKEKSPRRRQMLEQGLGHGSLEFLRLIWFPLIGNFEHLYPEWEFIDFNNGYRYLDFAYMPGGVKAGIEIQGFGPHARDLDVKRFKDLCKRQGYLALDGWTILPIAYLSLRDEPKQCEQFILSFVGKFKSIDVPPNLTWIEAETVRFSRSLLRAFTPLELADHLKISDRHARRVLKNLVERQILKIASGKKRVRRYELIV